MSRVKQLPSSGLYTGQEQCFEFPVPENYSLTVNVVPTAGTTVTAEVTKNEGGIVCVSVPENIADQHYRLEVIACPS